MNNVEKALNIAKKEINKLDVGTTFELRTIVCLKNLEFWWNLKPAEKREIGRQFKKLVLNKNIKNVKRFDEYSDKHNWYQKIK